jgi:hypothetical protein
MGMMKMMEQRRREKQRADGRSELFGSENVPHHGMFLSLLKY